MDALNVPKQTLSGTGKPAEIPKKLDPPRITISTPDDQLNLNNIRALLDQLRQDIALDSRPNACIVEMCQDVKSIKRKLNLIISKLSSTANGSTTTQTEADSETDQGSNRRRRRSYRNNHPSFSLGCIWPSPSGDEVDYQRSSRTGPANNETPALTSGQKNPN